eukprot:CAMPEP_0172792724 /NCGR_PEP_ID=MMETSP1074-20121228/209118_1 /TAXON_ID=2916 /ORGANISM="Ceratium fusus, Strain PA161109" /LENGTH=134 /DNA_ID=CAMNT_0013629793 /DNA_START=404 /DNA_END=808 /DNA_ORIENTATION=+
MPESEQSLDASSRFAAFFQQRLHLPPHLFPPPPSLQPFSSKSATCCTLLPQYCGDSKGSPDAAQALDAMCSPAACSKHRPDTLPATVSSDMTLNGNRSTLVVCHPFGTKGPHKKARLPQAPQASNTDGCLPSCS